MEENWQADKGELIVNNNKKHMSEDQVPGGGKTKNSRFKTET